MDNWSKVVCCIGAGYVGGPTIAVMASHCPQYKFIVADIDKRKIDSWNNNKPPFYEPDLTQYVTKQRGLNLFFTHEVEEAIEESEIIFIAVNTPTRDYGHWGGNAYDLSFYEAVSRTIARVSKSDKIIVEKSTVPVKTGKIVRSILDSSKNGDIKMEVVSNPEFLAESTAIRDLENPDRVLIGSLETAEGEAAVQTLKEIYQHWVPEHKIVCTGLWSAELTKLAANAFLAQRISSINALSAVCEKTDADILEVAHVLGLDPRIGSKYLTASVGFGGSCFGKDLLGLIYLCESCGLKEVAAYWQSVLVMNQYQKTRFAKKIIKEMFDNVKNKNICVLGFSFKKGTGDTRESPAIDVCTFLCNEGANLFVYDPKTPSADILARIPSAQCFNEAPIAASSCHALVLLTDWDEFKELDYSAIFQTMEKPAFVFDGRNILDHEKLQQIGYKVFCIGKNLKHDVS